MKKPILVIKFGTASITNQNGDLTDKVIAEIARQVSTIHNQYRIVLVSSGAVAAGKSYINNYKQRLSERKAAAAIGNTLLLNKYSDYFRPYGISIAQSLCERNHFSNRNQFLQLKKTYEKLWDNEIIPIANENDVVSNLELKFSDNDELATLIAVGFNASLLLFSTSVPGVLDEHNQLIRELDTSNKDLLDLARKEKSASGLGGMTSKLTYTRLANQMGVQTVIFGINTPDGILKALNNETGTVCKARFCSMSAKKRWLASGSLIKGKVRIDPGAQRALTKRSSLLAVGIQEIIGDFEKGEVIEMIDQDDTTIAVAKTKVSSSFLMNNLNKQNLEVAHADDLVLI
ncbi:glutamate 5-kinase [Albibacterium indicum]|uniref:glutamate 5-kinase n=1 Tax=Albibacterium indicum TaxID=2292082 RepID=UPI000E472E36|nr:glutamate 5-kinase [Pedobacter indicus]